MSRSARRLLAIAVVLCAAAAGFYAATALAPERVRAEVVGFLERATRAEVEIASLRLVMGFPIRVDGTGLRLYDGALTVESASARMDVLSLLIGRPRLTRLRLDGAHLEAIRSPEGGWVPPIFKESDGEEGPEPVLDPLRAIEGAIRFLLTRPLLADTLVVRRSRVSLVHPPAGGSGAPLRAVFEGVNGRLMHSRLFGDARLFLRARVTRDGVERGRLEWTGTRDENDSMDVTMAATGVDLSALAVYLKSVRPGATLSGLLDGVAEFETAEPGVGRLALDLGVLDLEMSLADAGSEQEPLRLPSATLRAGIQLDDDRVLLSNARAGAGDLNVALEAEVARPLRDASRADVRVSLAGLALSPETAGKLASWLPAEVRERAASLATRLRSGRLAHAELVGDASVALWGQLLAGSLTSLPEGLRLSARLDDVAIDVDEANRIDHLDTSFALEDDTLEVTHGSADLNGGPLPQIQLTFRGVSKVLASPPEQREMTSSAEALVGLTPLFESLRGEGEEEAPDASRPTIALRFDHVYHPALLWPMHDVDVELSLDADADGVRIDVSRSAWGGVVLDGWVDWTVRPDRSLVASLEATELEAAPAGEDGAVGPASAVVARGTAPALPPALEPVARRAPWVAGRFEVGAFESPRWSQAGATGRFSAAGGDLRLEDVEIRLSPRGVLSAAVKLDLTHEASVPYEGRIAVTGADIETLITQRGAEGRFATGTLDASASVHGTLVPGRSLLHDATGDAQILAKEGAIQRSVPPVFALALASSSLNPFSRRDELRYRRGVAEFGLDAGRATTSGLDIEGPDVRLFVSGGLDLGPPFALDAEVVLFLFRQVDRALELIPIVNALLLGENQNLVAAYFELGGTWQEPEATAKPLRTLEEGPTEVLTKSIPRVMMRGMQAIGGLLRSGGRGEAAPADPPGAPSPDGDGAPTADAGGRSAADAELPAATP